MSNARLSLKVHLRPRYGERFQPTGFPDLGPAEYPSPKGGTSLHVESPQSMATRLDHAIWDPVKGDVIPALQGMPYVKLQHPEYGLITSVTEAHRLASAYLAPYVEGPLKAMFGDRSSRQLYPHEIAPTLLKVDPNCLVHGVFFPSLRPGGVRVARMLSSFIEASDASPALSGGAKLDRNDPSGPSEQKKGHVLFSRREYTSPEIVADFSLDLIQLESYGLSATAGQFLRDLSLLKIGRFLERGLRLRTACDLEVVSVQGDAELDVAALEKSLKKSLGKLAKSGELNSPAVWDVTP